MRIGITTSIATAIAIGVLIASNGGPPPVTITCDQSSISAADFTSDLAAISNGQTLCLTNAVNYGTFTGTNKNITIVAQSASGPEDPVNATLAVSTSVPVTPARVVIDGGRNTWDAAAGLNIPNAGFATGAANLTVKDFEIDGTGGSGRRWAIDPAPIRLQHPDRPFRRPRRCRRRSAVLHRRRRHERRHRRHDPAGPVPSLLKRRRETHR